MKFKLSVEDAIKIAEIYDAKYVAMDGDREIYVYSNEPEKLHQAGYWGYLSDRDTKIGVADSSWNDNWEETLIEVDKYESI